VYVAATGLGVWIIHPEQKRWLKEVYLEILSSRSFSHISDIVFSWADSIYFSDVKDLQYFKESGNHITLHTAFQNPAKKLIGKDAGKLLVASYAWDGNAFPGNEYWTGLLGASGDPAAACCSMITELQNPYINPNVSSQNLQTYE
jgi:uncharacterized protein DUF4804